MHAPATGFAAYVVCDIVYPKPVRALQFGPPRTEPIMTDTEHWSSIVGTLVDWAYEWTMAESDDTSQHEKLAVVLEERWESLSAKGRFSYGNLSSTRDRAIVDVLMECEDFEVGFAGEYWNLFFPIFCL